VVYIIRMRSICVGRGKIGHQVGSVIMWGSTLRLRYYVLIICSVRRRSRPFTPAILTDQGSRQLAGNRFKGLLRRKIMGGGVLLRLSRWDAKISRYNLALELEFTVESINICPQIYIS
jgi:hypothetical protein